MPTYKNNTTSPITVEDTRIEAGQTVKLTKTLSNYPTGISLESAAPFYQKVLASSINTGTGTIVVPKTYTDSYGKTQILRGNYKISVYVSVNTGSCTVKLNDASDVARYVGLYEKYEIVCMDRIVENVIVTISNATANVTIELI